VQAFSQLAKTNNTVLLPEKTGDISSMVAQVHDVCMWLDMIVVAIASSEPSCLEVLYLL